MSSVPVSTTPTLLTAVGSAGKGSPTTSVHLTSVHFSEVKCPADKSTPDTKTPPLQHCGPSPSRVAKQSVTSSIPKPNQSWQFLPHLRLPKASDSESWSSVDNWIRENITPRVLQAVDIESKYQQLTVTLSPI